MPSVTPSEGNRPFVFNSCSDTGPIANLTLGLLGLPTTFYVVSHNFAALTVKWVKYWNDFDGMGTLCTKDHQSSPALYFKRSRLFQFLECHMRSPDSTLLKCLLYKSYCVVLPCDNLLICLMTMTDTSADGQLTIIWSGTHTVLICLGCVQGNYWVVAAGPKKFGDPGFNGKVALQDSPSAHNDNASQ